MCNVNSDLRNFGFCKFRKQKFWVSRELSVDILRFFFRMSNKKTAVFFFCITIVAPCFGSYVNVCPFFLDATSLYTSASVCSDRFNCMLKSCLRIRRSDSYDRPNIQNGISSLLVSHFAKLYLRIPLCKLWNCGLNCCTFNQSY